MYGLEGLLAGRTLVDRYRIDEVIGRGGFAAVYRAMDQRLGRTVAVKVITVSAPDAEKREEIRRRFDREARIAASLHHPNVVTVYDFGTDPELGLDFLVMELLQGEDLARRLRRPDPLPLPAAVRVLRDAAWGIAAGHQGGLIHRDVKPGNIFLAENDRPDRFRVCVLDFGIAQIQTLEHSLTRLTRGPTPLSPAYASPEQLREERDLTPASDVYGLGVIGYQMLAGERPFSSNEVYAIARGEGLPVPPLRNRNPEVSPGLEAVLARALAFAPEDRFPDAYVMAEALDEAYAGMKSTSVPPPPRAERPSVVPVPEPVVAEAVAPEPEVPAPAAPEPVVEPAPRRIPDEGLGQEHPTVYPVREPEPVRPARRAPVGRIALVLLLVAGAFAALWALGRGRSPEPRVARATRATAAPQHRDSAPTQPPARPENPVPQPGSGVLPTPAAVSPEAAGNPDGSASGPARPAPGVVAVTPSPPSSGTSTGGVVTRSPSTARPPAVVASVPVPAASGGAGAARLNREGEGLFERGDVAGAVSRFRGAVAAAPGNAYYHNNLGWALFEAGELEGAGREIEQAIRLDPRRAIAYANLGEVRWARGDHAGAIAAYERFLELNGDPRRERIARAKLTRMRGAG
ncbi:MAG: protein kinase [Gemmatimonadetes bacterium]|nr:protein kinase [Gemmatimonadota bacterium]